MRSTLLRAALLSAALLLPAPSRAANSFAGGEISDLVASLLPGVVNVIATRYRDITIKPGQAMFTDKPQPGKKKAQGSGSILTPDGYVLTNKHVVHNAISLTVTLSDGEALPADIVAESVAFDVAVIKIRTARPLATVKLGDSDTLRQGDSVIAIGNPLGFSSTVSTGIISAFNRDQGFTEFDDYMQTDAAINQGNSGGPLFNAKGEQIGVNSAIFTTGADTGNVGIGLVLPINDVKFVVLHMRDAQFGKPTLPGTIGAGVKAVTPDLAAAYRLPGPWGAVIASIAPAGPAANAKLRIGDVITFYGSKPISDSRALMRAVVESPPGVPVALGLWRDGAMERVVITPEALPTLSDLPVFLGDPGAPKPNVPAEVLANFGLQMAAITPELRNKYGIAADREGVVVTGVGIASEAADRGVGAGLVIQRVRNTAVTTPEQVLALIDTEREHKHPAVPMLIADPVGDGLNWVPFTFD
jgi:serine protease Do